MFEVTAKKKICGTSGKGWRLFAAINMTKRHVAVYLALLDASTHLIRGSVRRLVGLSVSPEIEWKQRRMTGKVEIWIPDFK